MFFQHPSLRHRRWFTFLLDFSAKLYLSHANLDRLDSILFKEGVILLELTFDVFNGGPTQHWAACPSCDTDIHILNLVVVYCHALVLQPFDHFFGVKIKGHRISMPNMEAHVLPKLPLG